MWECLKHKRFCFHPPANWIRTILRPDTWEVEFMEILICFLCFAAGSPVGPNSKWRLGHSPQRIHAGEGILTNSTLWHPAGWYVCCCLLVFNIKAKSLFWKFVQEQKLFIFDNIIYKSYCKNILAPLQCAQFYYVKVSISAFFQGGSLPKDYWIFKISRLKKGVFRVCFTSTCSLVVLLSVHKPVGVRNITVHWLQGPLGQLRPTQHSDWSQGTSHPPSLLSGSPAAATSLSDLHSVRVPTCPGGHVLGVLNPPNSHRGGNAKEASGPG